MLRFFSFWISIFLGASAFCSAQGQDLSSWRKEVVYEIFVRSFQDSNGDGVGDLDGITSRLDYLHELGVTAIWLTPIFPSPSYHGYDVTDYEAINPDFGNMDSFDHLLGEAHQRQLKVILDIPVNHTSSSHPWFLASQPFGIWGPSDTYLWSSVPLVWSAVENALDHWHLQGGSYYYSTFGEAMPDLNWKNPDVLSEIEKVFIFWIQRGVDGFRLDAAQYLDKGPNGEANTAANHQIWKKIVQACKAINPFTYFVGEVWTDSATIATYKGDGDELTQAFDFPLAAHVVNAVVNHDPVEFYQGLLERMRFQRDPFFASPFLTNHDQVRLATLAKGSVDQLKLAAAILFTLPGTPYLYYGEEIGLPEGIDARFPDDLGKRTPMSWERASIERGFTWPNSKPWQDFSSSDSSISVDAQRNVPGSLLSSYQELIHLKRTTPSLIDGTISAPVTLVGKDIVVYLRKTEAEVTLVALNFSPKDTPQVLIDLARVLPPYFEGAVLKQIYGREVGPLQWSTDTSILVPWIPADSAVVLKLTKKK